MRRLILAAVLAIGACASLVHAAPVPQPDGVAAVDGAGALMGSKITLPWGAYVSAGLGWAEEIAVALVLAIVAWAGRALPSFGVSLATEFLTQQRISRAVHYAITQVEGAVHGKTISVDASNALVAMAERYMLTMAPNVARSLGERLKPMILAKISQVGLAPEGAVQHALPFQPIPQTIK